MALSGAGETRFARHRLLIEWNASQNIAGNFSTVNVQFYLQSLDAYGGLNAPATNSGSININGNVYNFSANSNLAANQKKLIWSGSVNVPHNADGSKSFTITGNYNVNVTFSGVYHGNKTVSTGVDLNKISRPFSFITNAQDQTFDSPTTFNVSQNNSGLKANLYLHFGNKKLLLYSSVPIGSNFTVTVKGSDFADQITSNKLGRGNFVLETLSGTTVVGSNQVLVQFTLPNNATYQPTISSAAAIDTNTAVVAVTGSNTLFVQGKSNIRLTVVATAKNGASIVGYQVVVAGQILSSSSNIIDIPLATYELGSGDITAVVTATDSRGYLSTKSVIFAIQLYAAPKITSFSAERNATTNTTLEVKKVISVASIKNGITEKNTYTVTTRTKLTSAATWTVVKTETSTSANFNLTGYATDKSYDIQITVVDKFGTSVSSQLSVSTVKVLMDLYKDIGVGIGKLYEDGRGVLDVGGSSYYTGPVNFLGGIEPIRIPSTADLNNYVTPGMYFNNLNVEATAIGNTPMNRAFSLFVEKHAGFKQTWTEYSVLDPSTWTRNCYAGTWGVWKKIGYLIDAYPIGCIYESTDSANPATLFGGTWERFGNGRVLVGVNESDADLDDAVKAGGSTNPLTQHGHSVTGSTYRTGTSGTSNTLGRSQDLGNVVTGNVSNISAANAGNNANHSNWQPYITAYRWRRTA